MKLPEHLAFSYLLAQLGAQQQYGSAGTALVMAAGCLPDLDGLTVLAGWNVYRTYHRIIGHGVLVTLLGPALLALAGYALSGPFPLLPLWGWLQLACLGHLVTDVLFYRWPVQLLWPFSSRGWGSGLLRWNDLVPTLVLYGGVACALAWHPAAPTVAVTALGALALYIAWRAAHREVRSDWGEWLTGGWARRSAPIWRWLTGDFVT